MQHLFCPVESEAAYVAYMIRRKIPFKRMGRTRNAVLGVTQVEFRIPRNRRPHRWKLGV